MSWYDELQCQVEKCVCHEPNPLMSEMLADIGIEAMIDQNDDRLHHHSARQTLFSRLRHYLFRS
ncbi:hypothetical protein [Mixta intestinalis]|jgi:hypothetical protein|uniref:Uncharacterized protein n=1 Tax=Mixta intestinalis TaxID=1615494 RepID=A0A6P1Q247_9GAMM|nr:hypothetical protein [Mixta intestinalis]QHM72382.1 hypothetical protein C7M51_02693 [Mixta intestinalis]